MAFPDTITITINSVAKILTRSGPPGEAYSSEYLLRNANIENFKLKIRNTSYTDKVSKRLVDRHTVDFVHTVFAVAPVLTDTVRHIYCVLENQQTDTIVDPAKTAAGFAGFLTEANFTKLINLEA